MNVEARLVVLLGEFHGSQRLAHQQFSYSEALCCVKIAKVSSPHLCIARNWSFNEVVLGILCPGSIALARDIQRVVAMKPIIFPETPGWEFRTDEVSASVFVVVAKYVSGATIEKTGTDPDVLLDECHQDAMRITKSLPPDSPPLAPRG